MLKIIFFLFGILFLNQNLFSQRQLSQLWTEVGVSKKVSKKLKLSLGLTNRFGETGLTTTFSQFSVKYFLTNWLRPSIDYRLVSSQQKNGSYLTNNRINTNIQFSKDIKRLSFKLRLRYQYSFSKFNQSNYDPEFDLAYRFRPSMSYDINNSIISPTMSVEYFYNPENSALGNRFTKTRYILGFDLELEGAHELTFAYILDQQINLPDPLQKHIFSISYNYKLKSKKKN
jgi:hypothetical protein